MQFQSVAYLKRPIRNITARSYSETTLKQINNEMGNDIIINKAEQMSAIISMHVERAFRPKNMIKKRFLTTLLNKKY